MKYEVSDEQIEALAWAIYAVDLAVERGDDPIFDWPTEADKRVHVEIARELHTRHEFQEILRATAEEHWDRAAILCGDLGASTAHLLRANPHRKAAQ